MVSFPATKTGSEGTIAVATPHSNADTSELRLLGFDARIVPDVPGGSRRIRRSIDITTWPSVFEGDGGVGLVPPVLEEPYAITPFGERSLQSLWADLDYLRYCLRSNAGRIGCSYEIIAIGIHTRGWSDDQLDAWDERVYCPITQRWLDFWEEMKVRPDTPDPAWELLGCDVGDAWLTTLMPHPAQPGATMPPGLNEHYLFEDVAAAEAWRAAEEASMQRDSHYPPFVYLLWRVEQIMFA
jgi:hypothetical protein